MSNSGDMGEMSMRELLRMEVEGQSQVLIENLLEAEQVELNDGHLEALMRAAHSVKGGARIAELQPVVELAHVMEDLFVAARAGELSIEREHVDALIQSADLLMELANVGAAQDEIPAELCQRTAQLCAVLNALLAGQPVSLPVAGEPAQTEAELEPPEPVTAPPIAEPVAEPAPPAVAADTPGEQPSSNAASAAVANAASARNVRVSVESMNRMMNLVGELSVTRNVAGYVNQSIMARRRIREAKSALERLQRQLGGQGSDDSLLHELSELAKKIESVDEFLQRGAGELEAHNAHLTDLSRKMRREVISHRMQPFGDVAQGFKRLVRTLDQSLQKELLLDIQGAEVGVDRDILERLNAPLTHLIQNSADHGIESLEQRLLAGKPAAGKIRLSARHHGGLLSIVVEDDGRGIDVESLRRAVVAKQLVTESMAASLQDHELLEFIFLPNFSLSETVSQISGRGVGLDLVRHTLQDVRGTIRISTRLGQGTRFEITLPVTLIVLRCVIVQIGGELFALPAGRIAQAVKVARSAVKSLENRQYLSLEGYQVGLVSALELLELPGSSPAGDELSVVVLGQGPSRYGLVVDKLVGERSLVERPLDPRLGKVEDVSSMSLLDDGSPVLILNVDDLLHSIERLASGRLRHVGEGQNSSKVQGAKRILVVDDSITVREVERGLLSMQGYAVDVAVDGVDGWNALRTSAYDLLVTDVDMPRMDGIELVRLVRADSRLQHLPVIIISYKDREEDRLKGLEVGADRYLTKGSFQDQSFIQTVAELIAEAR